MAWPEAPEYRTALEHPELCFSDAELLHGKPVVDAQGQPVVTVGTASVVYKVADEGKPPLAAKCYTRTPPDLAARYQALAAHLKPLNLPFLVDCQLLEQGIKVGDAWFPVLKMPWVEGTPLHLAVKDNLDKPRLFATLAELWLRIATQLRKAQVAHGDVQHGNLLLVAGAKAGAVGLRLVDYDGMFVPALADKPAGEMGHPAYQHPRRGSGGYGPEMDRFGHLVIYAALRLLALGGKTLWQRHDNGDNLLFRAEDFANPATSKLLRDTQSLKDAEVKALAAHVFLASQGPPEQVPLLEEIVVQGKTTPLTAAQEAEVKKWLTPAAAPKAAAPAKPAAPPAAPNGEPAPPIKIRCDGCKKTLSVKAHLAGKKVACPVCKKPLVIPAPVAAPVEPPPDLEALAAAAFFDDPQAKKVETVEGKPIDFNCPWCDEELHFNAELAGKQEPCPHCSRIVKVPVPKVDKPKDWRQVDKSGPSMAKRDEAEPEDVWTSSNKARVSRDSLEEAGAIVEVQEPVSAATWVRRGLLTALVLAVAVGGYFGLTTYFAQSQQQQAIGKAMEAVEKKKLDPLANAAVYRAAGEFYLHDRQAKKAYEYYLNALRSPFTVPKETSALLIERDAFLIDVALNLIDLGGSDADEIDNTKIKWDKVQNELGKVLLQLHAPEAKQTALREVCARMIQRGKTELALGLAASLSSPIEKQVVVGDGIDPLKKKILVQYPPVAAQYVALLLKENKAKEAKEIAAPPAAKEEGVKLIARQGYAEGWAHEGKFGEALDLVKRKGPPLERYQASLGVAAVAILSDKASEALQFLEYAQACAKELKTPIPAWDQLQLARLLARAGKADEAKAAVDRLDKAGKSRGQLELLLARLATAKEQVPFPVEEVADKESLSYGLAQEAVARLNTRLGQQGMVTAAAEGAEERHRPFLFAGMALGLQDGRK